MADAIGFIRVEGADADAVKAAQRTASERAAVEAAALPPVTLTTMRLVCTTIASDIEDEQLGLVARGLRRAVDPARAEEARVLRKIDELLGRLKGNEKAMELLGFHAKRGQP